MTIELDNRWGYIYNLNTGQDLELNFSDMQYFTVDFWIKCSNNDPKRINNEKPAKDSKRIDSEKFLENININGITIFKHVHLPINEWQHIVTTNGQRGYLNPSLFIYLNGIYQSNVELEEYHGLSIKIHNTLSIEESSKCKHFSIKESSLSFVHNTSLLIGKIKVYNRILTHQEILENYKNLASLYRSLTIYGIEITNGLILSLPSGKNSKYIRQSNETIVPSEMLDVEVISDRRKKCTIPRLNFDIRPSSRLKKEIKSNNSYMNFDSLRSNNQPNSLRDPLIREIIVLNDTSRLNSDLEQPDIGIGKRKTRILLDYLKGNPKLFIEVLNSDILTIEQLQKLADLIQLESSQNQRGGSLNNRTTTSTSTGSQPGEMPAQIVNTVNSLYRLIHTKNNQYNSVYNKLKALNAKIVAEEQTCAHNQGMNIQHISLNSETSIPYSHLVNGTSTPPELHGSVKSSKADKYEHLFSTILQNQREILGLLLKNGRCIGHINRNDGRIVRYSNDSLIEKLPIFANTTIPRSKNNNRLTKILINADLYNTDIANINRRNKRLEKDKLKRRIYMIPRYTLSGGSRNEYLNSDMQPIYQGINQQNEAISYLMKDLNSHEIYYYPIETTKIINNVPLIAVIATPNTSTSTNTNSNARVEGMSRTDSKCLPVSKEEQVLSSINHGLSEEHFCLRNPVLDQNWVNM